METLSTDPVIVTRLSPRAQAAHVVVRENLLESLSAEKYRRLILVEAPAGYGKTSLLSQWRERLLATEAIVGWLTLDPDDRTAGDLIVYVLHALVRGGMRYDGPSFEKVAEDSASLKRHMRLLLNAISAMSQPTVLMLDEFEHIGANALETVITPMLRHAPDNLQITLATRQAPQLKLSALKAEGLVRTISTDELRFSSTETNQLFGGILTPLDLDAINRRMSGWPVMLQLLRGVWREAENPAKLLHDIEDLSEAASDYLSEQVLSELLLPVQTALVKTSLLDTLSAGGFEALLGTSESWQAVNQASLLKPFLTIVDVDLEAYKLHPVVRAFLQTRFQQLPADEQQQLSLKAAGWYARAGRYRQAVRHALSAGDTNFAGHIIEDAGGVQIWIRKGFSHTKQLDEMLAPAMLEYFPRLKLMRALVLVKTGRTAEGHALYEEARRETENFTCDRTDGNNNALRLDSLIVGATLLVNECRVATDDYLTRHAETIRLIGGHDDLFLGNAKILLCIANHQKGHFSDGLQYAEECISHYRHAEALHGEFFAHLHKGVIHLATGQPKMALDDYQKARNLWHRHFDDDRTKLALVTPLTMEVHYETGAAQPVLKKLRESNRELLHSEGWLDIFAAEYVTSAMASFALEGPNGALATLTHADGEIHKRQLKGLEPIIQATRISCLALSDQIQDAEKMLSRIDVSLDRYALRTSNRISWREREAILTAAARVWLRTGDNNKVIGTLSPLIGPLQASNMEKTAIRLGIFLALAHRQSNHREAFITGLGSVLRRIRRHGYIRGFLEEGRLAREALADYMALQITSSDPDTFEVAQEISTILSKDDPRDSSTVLTPRETDVLRILAQGYTDKKIARELGLTHNTVRYHLKNIYNKLGTTSRLDAVLSARQNNLID